ncbi:sulfite exporter TauE/SafE family protein [Sunxiuqinia sp. A32]|uniref:sulfite exporter TauE/SafE family protein n=1 Tax=Sunxiuqinia sp. A32 TaxID=3461496 RepID=UPI00404654D7
MIGMSVSQIIILIIVGLLAGLLGGTLGVGGAIVVIPSLVLIFGFAQHQAQGTALAFMLPPVTLLATINYWKEGYVNWKFALILSITFFIGAYLGSILSFNINEKILKKVFGVFIIIVALKMIFSK